MLDVNSGPLYKVRPQMQDVTLELLLFQPISINYSVKQLIILQLL